MKVLVAVDGSGHSLNAVEWVADHASQWIVMPDIELVFVNLPVPRLPHMKLVLSDNDFRDYYEEEGRLALAGAKNVLDNAAIPHTSRMLVGSVAESIIHHASKISAEIIVLAPRGMGAVADLLLGSVASKVTHLSPIPVLIVK